MSQGEFIDTPESQSVEMNIELRARKRAERNRMAEQEKEPDPATVFFWRRVYLKLEKHSQWLIWQQVFKVIMTKSLQPDLCTHSDVTALIHSGNKYASQTYCQKCEKIVIYTHTKDGAISWMQQFGKLVAQKKIPAAPWVYHPDDPDASRYCKRCVHPMIRVGKTDLCSQYKAAKPCKYMRNGHLPPGDDRNRANQGKINEKKNRL